MIEVQHRTDRSLMYLVCLSDCFVYIFMVNISGMPTVSFVKKIAMEVDCGCAALWHQYKMYLAQGNKITTAQLNFNLKTADKILQMEEQIKFTNTKQTKVTAMKHTFLKAPDSEADEDMESILVAATEQLEFVIIKDGKVTSLVKNCHDDNITQILVLTDYQVRLTFVTLSFDGTLRFWNDEGVKEQEAE